MLTDGLVWIIVMFLSDSHSDGTHSLQSIWWKATFLQIWWRNKLICILDSLMGSKYSTIFLSSSFKSFMISACPVAAQAAVTCPQVKTSKRRLVTWVGVTVWSVLFSPRGKQVRETPALGAASSDRQIRSIWGWPAKQTLVWTQFS